MSVDECPICTNLFTYQIETNLPKLLPCGHTFCNHCLYQIFRQSQITCPQCRVTHHLTDYNTIPRNYLVIELLEYQSNLLDNNNNNQINSQQKKNKKKKIYSIEPGEVNSNELINEYFKQFERRTLESLTINEVKNLLIHLKLSKFVDKFEENEIDGLSLTTCQ